MCLYLKYFNIIKHSNGVSNCSKILFSMPPRPITQSLTFLWLAEVLNPKKKSHSESSNHKQI